MIPCLNHPDAHAAHQLTLYCRVPTVAPIWRGTVCADCLTSTMALIKKNGPSHILLIWPVKA